MKLQNTTKNLQRLNYNATVNPLIAKRVKLNENNDGQGNISVYAESDGVIQSVFASMGYQLKEGDKVVSIGSDEAQMMSLSLNTENSSGSGMGEWMAATAAVMMTERQSC